MNIAKELPKQDQEHVGAGLNPAPPKKPYTTPRLTTYGDVKELTRGTGGTLRTDAASPVIIFRP